MTNPPTRPLPVSATFVRAYHIVWHNRVTLLHGAVMPFLLLTASFALFSRIGARATPQTDPAVLLKSVSPRIWLAIVVCQLGGTWTLLSLNVSWRRHLLGLGTHVDCLYFRMPFWRYILTVFVATLLFVGLALFLTWAGGVFVGAADLALRGSLKTQVHLFSSILTALFIAALAACAGLLLRHILVFTQAMTDEHEAPFHPLREAMRGNVGRLVLIWLLTSCTTLVAGEIFSQVFRLFDLMDLGVQLALGAVNSLLFVIITLLMSTVAALVYDYLVRKGGPGTVV